MINFNSQCYLVHSDHCRLQLGLLLLKQAAHMFNLCSWRHMKDIHSDMRSFLLSLFELLVN